MTIALLLIDIQNDSFPGGAWELEGMAAAAERAATLLARFREQGRPVIHVRHEFESTDAPFFRPGSDGAGIHPTVAPAPGEAVFTKHAVNAFQRTSLQPRLRSFGIEELVVVGAMSHMCIEGTTRAAADLGYRCRVVHDACATRGSEFGERTVSAADVHAAAMATLGFGFADVVTADEALAALTAETAAPQAGRDAATPTGREAAMNPDTATVSLREIDEATIVSILKLDVAPAQRGFVATNAVSLSQAHFSEHAWHRAIYADDTPVGFVMLSDNPADEGVWLWRLMIDQRHQGCGYGRHAMEQVFDHVRTLSRPDVLFTSVVEGHGSPRPFYEGLGFLDTGEIEDGETVLRRDLTAR